MVRKMIFIKIIKSLKAKFLKQFRPHRNIEYDKKIFLENTKQSIFRKYKLMKKDQLRSFIIIDCHRLEKGLSFRNIKPNFGVESKVLKRLLEMHQIFIKRFGDTDYILLMIYESLETYKNWHLDNNLDYNYKEIDNFLINYEFLKKRNKKKKHGGIIEVKKEKIMEKVKSFKEGIQSRRSIRVFSKEPVSNKIIRDCISRAIKGTPTVCNRPINKVYIIKSFKKRKALLKYQNGNSGYGISAPVLLIITSRLFYFQDDRERRSPYTGGGMFSMSLAYSFHAEGLGTCCLNMDTNFENDIAVRKILNAKNETVIMFMLVGNLEEKFNVAYSLKPNFDEVAAFIN